MRNDNLPSLLGAAGGGLQPMRRDLARIERGTQRDVALVRSRAHVAAERGRANVRAIEETGLEALHAGANVAQHAQLLANACPTATPTLEMILSQTGLALARTVSDTARDL